MSILASDNARLREFRGWQLPQLPIGYWAGQVSVVGDASGGVRQLEMSFNPSAAPRSSIFYSLEQVYITDTNNTTKVGVIESLSMDGVADLILNWVMSLPLTLSQTSAHTNAPDAGHLRGTWLGRQAGAAVNPRLRYTTSNINGSTLLMVVMGYSWSSRAIMAEGGPVRPANGLHRP